MNITAKQILEVLDKYGHMKARTIAAELEIDRKEVNHYLYSDLRYYCEQNSEYEWSLNKKGQEFIHKEHPTPTDQKALHNNSEENTGNSSDVTNEVSSYEYKRPENREDEETAAEMQQPAFERRVYTDPLQRLCHYYIDCVLQDQEKEKTVFAESNFDLQYCDITEWPDNSRLLSNDASDFIQKIMTSSNLTGQFGYPVLLNEFTSRNGRKVRVLTPVFLWDIDTSTGKIELSVTPTINTGIIKHYVTRSNEAVVNELLRLEKELGIYDTDQYQSVKQLVARLMKIRQWNWMEQLDPYALNPLPFKELSNLGIYNKAIIFSQDKSPFTKGLVGELEELSHKTLASCKGTALYDWISSNTSDKEVEDNRHLLELLPLNSEQKRAISSSLARNLTVVTGPPGTGKSQVVIDLLANQVKNGKSVLFSSKNNKAVEVVIDRAEAISRKPFLIRLGGQAGNEELSDMLEKILNAKASPNATAEAEKRREDYERCLSLIEEDEQAIRNLINARNKVDELESKLTPLRNRKYNRYFNNETFLDLSSLKYKWDNYVSKQKLTVKENNGWWSRIRWSKVGPENAAVAFQAAQEVRQLFLDMEQPCPVSENAVQSINIAALEAAAATYFNDLHAIDEYRNCLRTLNTSPQLEELEQRLIQDKDRLSDLAVAYWDAWFDNNHTALAAKDRKIIIEYLNGVKLIKGASEEGIPETLRRQFRNVQKALPKYINAQAITLLSAKGRLPLAAGIFDLLVIDEASQCDIASALPLLFRAKRVAIIGDMNQLTHVSTLPKSKDQELLRKYGIDDLSWSYSVSSLFALGQSRADAGSVVKLREHHRSHADIIEFSNTEFYGGDLVTATKYERLKLPAKDKPGVRWINVEGQTVRPKDGGAFNKAEAAAVIDELKRLSEIGYEGTIGVISPFRAQAECIRNMLASQKELAATLQAKNELEIDTVHKFQGDERDIIVFSPTISSGTKQGATYFLNENGNLFNVAISRARAILITVGNRHYCEHCGIRYLERFVEYVAMKEAEAPQEIYDTIPTPQYPHVPNIDQVSEWEKVLYKALYQNGIITMPQYPVDKYKLDLALFNGDKRLDIEVDGAKYHMTWDGELCYRDQLRNQRLFELGWDVRRFWVQQIRDDINWCIEEIRKWLTYNN